VGITSQYFSGNSGPLSLTMDRGNEYWRVVMVSATAGAEMASSALQHAL